MKKITFAFFILLFLLFRPYQLQKSGMIYTGDDYSYFAYSTSIVFGTYPSFTKEYVDETAVPPLSRVGPGLMAAPFVFLFSFIDRTVGNEIITQRTHDSIKGSWCEFGFIFSTLFYFYFSCVLLFNALRKIFTEEISVWSVVLMVFAQGVGIYAFRRPVFSHIYELFLHSAFLYLFIKSRHDKFDLHAGIIIALSALMFMVRQNAIIFALVWPAIILFKYNKKSVLKLIVSIGLSFGIYFIIKNIPYWANPEPYLAVNKIFNDLHDFTTYRGIYFYLKRSYTVLFGADWGLFYTAPFLILSCYSLIKNSFAFNREHLILLFPVLVNFFIVVCWKGQGSYYGYRYFVPAAIPALMIPFGYFLKSIQKFKFWKIYISLISIVPIVSMCLFEATPRTTLWGVVTEFGEKNGGNLEYQIEVWKVIIMSPFYFILSFFKNGPAYIVYLLALLFGKFDILPEKFRLVYDSFSSVILLKTIILYLLPLVFYKLNQRLFLRPQHSNEYHLSDK